MNQHFHIEITNPTPIKVVVQNTPIIVKVNESGTGAAVWGAITGDINTQTDLIDLVNSTQKTRRHEWVAPYSYNGKAPFGSAENANVWTIVRIEVFADGTTDVKSATGAWTDRLTLNYT